MIEAISRKACLLVFVWLFSAAAAQGGIHRVQKDAAGRQSRNSRRRDLTGHLV